MCPCSTISGIPPHCVVTIAFPDAIASNTANGISIIAHGKSSARALKNAVKVAAHAAAKKLDAHISERLGESPRTGVKA